QRLANSPGTFLVKFTEIGDRDEAARLTGAAVEVAREQLRLGSGEYLVSDLVGMTAFAQDGRPLGAVIKVFYNGAHDVIELDSGQMAPLVDDWISAINLAERKVVFKAYEGF